MLEASCDFIVFQNKVWISSDFGRLAVEQYKTHFQSGKFKDLSNRNNHAKLPAYQLGNCRYEEGEQWLLVAFKLYYEGVQYNPGRESKIILQPDDLFLENINDYLYNRFLNIGRNIIHSSSNIDMVVEAQAPATYLYIYVYLIGHYPVFLWLFKEFLPTLKETVQFQGNINWCKK